MLHVIKVIWPCAFLVAIKCCQQALGSVRTCFFVTLLDDRANADAEEMQVEVEVVEDMALLQRAKKFMYI